ncbi:Pkinase-domain-containing protein [Patellaria atrata CBS 101060]|uniref:non-specific serine/threonine protein kinase n=1 Tax=Patellaria atrata CBS 101060 TaxID=1346257 RepID=A0A9P4VRU3_9PEZI|nr:Pkinase-domain-containing protein [Patellaria atrata CBS 101060]
MDRYPAGRPPSRRQILNDGTSKANATSHPQRSRKYDMTFSSSRPLPHDQFLVPNGTLGIRHASSSPQKPKGENLRLAATTNNEDDEMKRDSEVSQESTNVSDSASRRRKTHIGPWQLGRTIGKGGCSRVRAVRHRATGQVGAAKIVSKAVAEDLRAVSLANLIKSTDEDHQMFADGKVMPFGLEREIVIMRLLEHKNIVKLYDVWENRNELYLVMEYVQGGELFHYIEEQGGLLEVEVVYLFRQVIAALLYCHRIHIHHRDLKPENILLDRQTFEVKLVDFGMAALQPSGKWLSTPCGSPHYAAPEVIRNRPYDGATADIWSCGVILYVMLTGSPPFVNSGDDRDIRNLFRLISAGRYYIPDDLSAEARDLIQRILVPEPKHRITIEGIWRHPFLHKYDKEFNFTEDNSSVDVLIGPYPHIKQWDIKNKKDIDREIFRNLRTLWHSEPEDVLIQRLLSNEGNHEKFFYNALIKFRDERLQDYWNTGDVAYSASDKHHFRPLKSRTMARLASSRRAQSTSQFSIMNDEHLNSRHSFIESPPSEASYDPYRASKDPIISGDGDGYMNVTVHRGGSTQGNRMRNGAVLPGVRQPSSLRAQSLRIETLKRVSRRSSILSDDPSARSITSRSNIHRVFSQASFVSSVSPHSPPGRLRPVAQYKRNVSFTHLRRTSTASSLVYSPRNTPERPDQRSYRNTDIVVPGESSCPPADRVHRSANPAEEIRSAKLRSDKPRTFSQYIETETRKVSTELGYICDSAFMNESGSSVARTSLTDRPDPYNMETPPSSISNRGSRTRSSHAVRFKDRPLPPLPIEPNEETPNTFIRRELAETRERLAAKWAEQQRSEEQRYSTTRHFDEVLAQLDRLTSQARQDGRRISSAPVKTPDYLGPLPMIFEEGRFADADERSNGRHGGRAVTDPVGRFHADGTTIRMVEYSSPIPLTPLHPKPLTIRKKSSTPQIAQPELPNQPDLTLNPIPTLRFPQNPGFVIHEDTATDKGKDKRSSADTTSEKAKDQTLRKKKSSWFRRSKTDDKENQSTESARPKVPETWTAFDNNRARNVLNDGSVLKHTKRESDETSEFPRRATVNSKATGKRGFLKRWLGKKDNVGMSLGLGLASTANLSNTSLGSFDYDLRNPDPRDRLADGQTNWLSRFLHFKPACKVICFKLGRGRARQETVRLLREWRKYGARDVKFDRRTNVIEARVDKKNYLRIKPVSFVCELFVILEHGRRSNLTIARFTQTKGAAASFRKVIDLAEEVLERRGLLVEDDAKKSAMADVLHG